ncbi:hypothetical protein PIB30_060303 [Stylosanthes scabra]|uniref:RRM domain-containing protein n=1 Tax=Stylosanthes scabra TaxID=79078 RepID=A0ABU6YN27_9FABA|nr:hypothetical protein [Stylosanthes scabra]
MDSDRVVVWDRWVKKQREWTKERFRELEADSFSIFVDNLPDCVSKKELFHLFSWSGMINDIYIVRRMKEGMVHLFAFIRYTTKSGALKAIAEMNHTSLHGRRLFVVEARNRRVDKIIDMHETPRRYGEGEAFDNPMLKDYAAEWVMVNRDGDEELEGTTTLPYEILNEWFSKKINMTDRSESESSDRTATWNYGRKKRVEKDPFILEEVEGAMKLNSSFRDKRVCVYIWSRI